MIARYRDKDIHELWNPRTIYRRWFEVEVAHMREVAGTDVADAMDAHICPPSTQEVDYYERETGHDVAAFLLALDRNIRATWAPDHPNRLDGRMIAHMRSALHYGLTSSDVTDTALMLGILRSWPVVVTRAQNTVEALLGFIGEIPEWATSMGRTHGQLATPMPARHRWSVLSEMLERAVVRVDEATSLMDVGKLSGPVGIDCTKQEVSLARLDLRETESTQIVPRDRLAHWAHTLAELVSVCEAIATQVWLLCQSGVNELRFVTPGSVGSSAMPHKMNPILAENIRGLSRIARGYADMLQIGTVQWGEHDLAHNSVERIAVPDLLHLTCTTLTRTAVLVSGLSWEDAGRPAGYVDTSEELRQLQANGVPYVEAHAQLTALYRTGKITTTTTTPEESTP
jgi:adenylosuccinate lyase